MSEGWGGCGGPSSNEEHAPTDTREPTLLETADSIEKRAIRDARSMGYSCKDAPAVLAAFAVADRLREIASADTHPKDGDSTEIEAPLGSGAGGEAETPKGAA
jgi:hypothetical protein